MKRWDELASGLAVYVTQSWLGHTGLKKKTSIYVDIGLIDIPNDQS